MVFWGQNKKYVTEIANFWNFDIIMKILKLSVLYFVSVAKMLEYIKFNNIDKVLRQFEVKT